MTDEMCDCDWQLVSWIFSLQAFADLKACAGSRGWDIDVWSNKQLAESLAKCVDPQDPNVNLLLKSLATQAMEQAVYFSTGATRFGH